MWYARGEQATRLISLNHFYMMCVCNRMLFALICDVWMLKEIMVVLRGLVKLVVITKSAGYIYKHLICWYVLASIYLRILLNKHNVVRATLTDFKKKNKRFLLCHSENSFLVMFYSLDNEAVLLKTFIA